MLCTFIVCYFTRQCLSIWLSKEVILKQKNGSHSINVWCCMLSAAKLFKTFLIGCACIMQSRLRLSLQTQTHNHTCDSLHIYTNIIIKHRPHPESNSSHVTCHEAREIHHQEHNLHGFRGHVKAGSWSCVDYTTIINSSNLLLNPSSTNTITLHHSI